MVETTSASVVIGSSLTLPVSASPSFEKGSFLKQHGYRQCRYPHRSLRLRCIHRMHRVEIFIIPRIVLRSVRVHWMFRGLLGLLPFITFLFVNLMGIMRLIIIRGLKGFLYHLCCKHPWGVRTIFRHVALTTSEANHFMWFHSIWGAPSRGAPNVIIITARVGCRWRFYPSITVITITTARAVTRVITTTSCSWPSVMEILGVTWRVDPLFPLNKLDDSRCPVIRGIMRITIDSISWSGWPLSTITFIVLESL